MNTCPNAARLAAFLSDADEALLDRMLLSQTHEELACVLRDLGIDLSNCDRFQILQVIRDMVLSLDDADLAKVAGGEIAKTTKKVVGGTAVAGAILAGAGTVALGVGTDIAIHN